MADKGKILTALKFAKDEGCLICDIDGSMKNINVATETGYHRMKAILRDSPELVVGFYKVNDKFSEEQVKEYIQADTRDLM